MSAAEIHQNAVRTQPERIQSAKAGRRLTQAERERHMERRGQRSPRSTLQIAERTDRSQNTVSSCN